MTWYKCDCGSEVLHIEAEAERIADDKLVVYLNVSIMHVDSRRSLWNKLRHCWHILRTGKNYADLSAFAQADLSAFGTGR